MWTIVPWSYLDGNWIDIGSLIGAIVYAVREHKMCHPPRRFICRETGINIAHGTALFPLLLLGLSVFSSRITSELLTASRIILSAAGVVALLSILEHEQG